jgi:Amidohydrolase
VCEHHRLTRRHLLKVALAASALAALPVRADSVYDGPFVDAHVHLKWDVGFGIGDVISLYDAAGIMGGLLFGDPWSIATDARDRFPRRVVPFLAESYFNALHPDSSYVHPDGLAQVLQQELVKGLGEIICRHSAYQLGASGGFLSAPANNVPMDDAQLITAYKIAGSYQAPVTVHQEWFFADELERAVQAAPETTFIWAHAGHGPAETARGVLQRNANVMADLSARTPWIGPGTVLLRGDGSIDPTWHTVLEQYADRFMVGLDLFAPAHYQQGYVNQLTTYYRGLLGQLDPAVASMIGHQNAERIAPFAAA